MTSESRGQSMSFTVHPLGSKAFGGSVVLPGSKSLSNRYLLLGALANAQGTTQEQRLRNFLRSDDTARLQEALEQLGWSIGFEDEPEGAGAGGQTQVVVGSRRCSAPLDCRLFLGNAGTAYRPLAAVLSSNLFQGRFRLEGEPRMHERPIGPLVNALRQLGADVHELAVPGFPPLEIAGSTLVGGRCQLDCTHSSQFLSSLLMAAPLAVEPVEIECQGDLVSQGYVAMTIGLMAHFGVQVYSEGSGRFYRVEPQKYLGSSQGIEVESDATSASYFLAAGAIGGTRVRVWGVGRPSCQGELAFAEVLKRMGAQVRWGRNWVEVSRVGPLRGVDEDLRELPDAAMTLAVVALFAEGPTTIRGVANWKLKETDRQAALASELAKVGAQVELLEDGIRVFPIHHWKSARIETYNDHRMAMCFALTCFGPEKQEILDPGCVSKTFPQFFRLWQSLQA